MAVAILSDLGRATYASKSPAKNTGLRTLRGGAIVIIRRTIIIMMILILIMIITILIIILIIVHIGIVIVILILMIRMNMLLLTILP